MHTFFGMKSAEFVHPWACQVTLNHKMLSLWLGRCSSSVGQGGSAHTLVLYSLTQMFRFCSRGKILSLLHAVWSHNEESGYFTNSLDVRQTEVRTTKNIEKMRQAELHKGMDHTLQTNYVSLPPQLSTPLSPFPSHSLIGLWMCSMWNTTAAFQRNSISFIQQNCRLKKEFKAIIAQIGS